MANFYFSSDLITSIKERAFIPQNQNTFTESTLLRFATEEMMIGIVPKIVSLHEDYFLYTDNIPIQSNVSRYRIPYRALGNKLNDLAYLDNNNRVREMTRLSKADLPDYQGNYITNQIAAFYLEGNDAVLTPSVGSSPGGSLLFAYYMRPSKLVNEDRAGKIIDINTTTGEITFEELPSNFSLSTKLDMIMGQSPHKIITYDILPTVVNTSAKSVTFDLEDIPSELSVGDYILEAEETIIPQIPSDLHVMLAQRVACRCLEAMGDAQGLATAKASLAEMEVSMLPMIENRVESAPLKVINRHGHLRQNLYGRVRGSWRG